MKRVKYAIYGGYNPVFDLYLEGTTYRFNWRWSEVLDGWIYSIYRKDKPIIEGRVARLDENLMPGIKEVGLLILEGNEPTLNNLGNDCFLYYYGVENAAS